MQMSLDVRGQFDLVFGNDRERILAGRRVRDGRARRDDCRIIARDVRDHQGHERRWCHGLCKPTAFDCRQVLSHTVHFADVGAGCQERAIDRLLVVQAQTGCGRRRQGRAAARDKRDHLILGTQIAHQLEHPLGGGFAGGVRYRMCGLDNLDPNRRRLRDHSG